MILLILLLGLCNISPTQAQDIPPQEKHTASITRIVRHVAKGIMAPNQETLTPEQETLVAQVAQQLVQETEIYQAEQIQLKERRDERDEMITRIVINVSKGIAIVIALLVLRSIIGAIGRGVATEGADSPIGVIITTRTTEQALNLGKEALEQNWATGGTVSPTTQSLYRQDDKAYAAPEAMLMLKTTNQHLKNIVEHTETSNTSAPEIIAISRSIIPT